MSERTAAGRVSPNRWMELLGEAPNGVVGVRVGGEALRLRRRAWRTVVWLRRRSAGRWPAGWRRCARARGTWRPVAARRCGRRGWSRADPRGVIPKASAVSSWIVRRRRGRAARWPLGVEREDLVGELGGRRPPGQRGEGDDADQGALEGAHVVGHAVGDDLQHALIAEHDAVVLHALAQDGQARREVGRREVGDEAGLEALAQAGLEGARGRRQAVGGQHELAAGLVAAR